MIAAFKQQLERVHDDDEQQSEDTDYASFSSEESDEEIDEETTDVHDTDSEVLDYDKYCENMHNIAFQGHKRTSCFVHTLQLVVQVFDKLMFSKMVMKRVHRLVKKVNKSVKARNDDRESWKKASQ